MKQKPRRDRDVYVALKNIRIPEKLTKHRTMTMMKIMAVAGARYSQKATQKKGKSVKVKQKTTSR